MSLGGGGLEAGLRELGGVGVLEEIGGGFVPGALIVGPFQVGDEVLETGLVPIGEVLGVEFDALLGHTLDDNGVGERAMYRLNPFSFRRSCAAQSFNSRRLPRVFWLRQAPMGRRLSSMAPTGQKGRSESTANSAAGPVRTPGLPLIAVPLAAPLDSLHSALGVSGSAVQFNSSVSAMPATTSEDKSTLPPAGTADYTLLLCWAARFEPLILLREL